MSLIQSSFDAFNDVSPSQQQQQPAAQPFQQTYQQAAQPMMQQQKPQPQGNWNAFNGQQQQPQQYFQQSQQFYQQAPPPRQPPTQLNQQQTFQQPQQFNQQSQPPKQMPIQQQPQTFNAVEHNPFAGFNFPPPSNQQYQQPTSKETDILGNSLMFLLFLDVVNKQTPFDMFS